jgi:photosystem II stability/assembly factor-like uncharacterized protein
VDFTRWIDVTPSQVTANPGYSYGDASFESASFLDQRRGWVALFDPATTVVSVFRTVDGGRSWDQVQGAGHTMNAGAVTRLQFLTPSFGFMEIAQPSGPGADLLVTYDGGGHWSSRSSFRPGLNETSLPLADTWFVDPGHALATRPSWRCADRHALWSSSDGGRSWSISALPAEYATGGDGCISMGSPRISGVSAATLPITSMADDGSHIGFLTSSDAGATWRVAGGFPSTFSPARTQYPGSANAPVPVGSVAADESWWVAGTQPSGTLEVAVSNDQGRHWERPGGRGLVGQPRTLIARSARAAWCLVSDGPNSRLFATSDGGASWTPVAPSSG